MKIPFFTDYLKTRRQQRTDRIMDLVDAYASVGHQAVNIGGAYNWKTVFGNLHPSQLRGASSAKHQLALSAIYAALNLYIGHISGVPRLTRVIDSATGATRRYVKPTETPSARLWNWYVNDDQSSTDMLKVMIHDLLYADGNFYALPTFNERGEVARLNYLHYSRVPAGNIKRAQGGELITGGRNAGRKAKRGVLLYKVLTGSVYRDKEPEHMIVVKEDIFHMKGLIPDSEFHRSQGILEHNFDSAELYEAAERMGRNFYKHGYNTQMYLSTEHQLGPKLKKDIEAMVNNEEGDHISLDQMFKTRILEKGLKPVHVGLPLEAIKFIETRAFSVEDVGRWFNIPPILLHSLIGVGNRPDNLENQMLLFIQNGLGPFMQNLSQQFRSEVLSLKLQPIYSFDFSILHLYRSVINEFSQALRNLFEIGFIDRQTGSELLGVPLSPSSENSQRYVPANLVTTDHSKALEEKAQMALNQMKVAIEQAEVDLDHTKNPPEPSPMPDNPDEDDVPNPADKKPADEKNSDKKIRPVFNAAVAGLLAAFTGLREYETKVLNQKKQSRPDDYAKAIEEWRPSFEEKLTATATNWQPVLQLANVSTADVITNWNNPDYLQERFDACSICNE